MISLPMKERLAFDTSITQTSQRCPRKAQYQYFYNRSGAGRNVPIAFGLAYHKFREVLERQYLDICMKQGMELNKVSGAIYKIALGEGMEGYEDPPLEHKKAYLTRGRLQLSCEQAFMNWTSEKRKGIFTVLEAEQAFQLELPDGTLFGGRFDQVLEWNGKLWVKDFKTTGRMGKDYPRQFDPNDQITAYTWAASKLSGRRVGGVIIEVVYNTKSVGPTHFPFVSARTDAHIEEWLRDVQMETKLLRSYYEDNYFPKRTTGCGDFGGCYFRECCAMSSDKMREAWLLAKTIESEWDFMNPDKEKGVTD